MKFLGGFETFWNSEIHWLMWTTTNSEFSPIFQLVFHIRKPSIYDLDLAPLWIWLWGPKSNLPILQVCGIDFLTKLSVRENHLAVKMVACNSSEIYWPLILTQFKMTSLHSGLIVLIIRGISNVDYYNKSESVGGQSI